MNKEVELGDICEIENDDEISTFVRVELIQTQWLQYHGIVVNKKALDYYKQLTEPNVMEITFEHENIISVIKEKDWDWGKYNGMGG